MSGPPGRSSSGEPAPDWPAEDLDSRSADARDEWSANGREADPWSAGDDPLGDPNATRDPWQGPRDEFSLGWDDWPPVTPPTDYALGFDEPLRPSSDPWAESWLEEPAEPTGYRPEPEEPRERQEPMQSQAAWAPAEPAPAPGEARAEPAEQAGWSAAPAIEAGPVDEAAAEPAEVEGPPLEPAPEEGGRAEQWASPWRADTAPDWVVEPVEAASEPLPFLPEDEPQLVTQPEAEDRKSVV